MTGRRHRRAGSRWNRHPGKISSNRPARQHGTVLRTSGTVPSSCPGKITQPSGCNRFSRRPSAITPSAGTAGAHGAYAARASARAICSGDRGLKANPQGPHQNRHRRPSCGTTGRRRTGHQTAGSATGRRPHRVQPGADYRVRRRARVEQHPATALGTPAGGELHAPARSRPGLRGVQQDHRPAAAPGTAEFHRGLPVPGTRPAALSPASSGDRSGTGTSPHGVASPGRPSPRPRRQVRGRAFMRPPAPGGARRPRPEARTRP